MFLSLIIFTGVKEDLDNMEIVELPGIPVKNKRLSHKQKRLEMELALGRKKPEHASYAAAVINAPYLPVEVAPQTQQSDLKRKGWKVYRAVQSRDRNIQKL